MNLNFLEMINSRVMASVCPTPHTNAKRIWISSGRVPLHDYLIIKEYKNVSV